MPLSSTATPKEGMPSAGQMIDRFRVGIKLGEGGFGAVFKVTDTTNNQQLAMKCESQSAKNKSMSIEVQVLSRIKPNSANFCRVYERGTTPQFEWVVMTLVGKNLSELRKSTSRRRLSLSTVLRSAHQTISAIKQLHLIGFVHRDIKPANFAIGREEDSNTNVVFLLDFGMCRAWCDPVHGKVREPRKDVGGFRGTMRYAPINSHSNRELGRKDDLEMWMYMLIELANGELPWRMDTVNKIVAEKKTKLRDSKTSQEKVFKYLPSELRDLMYKVHRYKYEDMPDYSYFRLLLEEVMRRTNIKMDDRYDWEPNPPPRLIVTSQLAKEVNKKLNVNNNRQRPKPKEEMLRRRDSRNRARGHRRNSRDSEITQSEERRKRKASCENMQMMLAAHAHTSPSPDTLTNTQPRQKAKPTPTNTKTPAKK